MYRVSQHKNIQPQKNRKIAIFQNLTDSLQTQFFQLPNGQNAKFQCLSDAEFPEFFFYPSTFLVGVMVKRSSHTFFVDTLYTFSLQSTLFLDTDLPLDVSSSLPR